MSEQSSGTHPLWVPTTFISGPVGSRPLISGRPVLLITVLVSVPTVQTTIFSVDPISQRRRHSDGGDFFRRSVDADVAPIGAQLLQRRLRQ